MLEDIDDGPEDPQMESWYRHMTERARPEGFKLEIRFGTEGPREDPYGWTEYRVTLPDGRRALYRDGMLSERLEVDTEIGLVIFESPDYPAKPGDLPMDVMFEDFVGFDTEQLMFWDNQEQEKYADIREAELAAGWDPSP